MSWATFGSIFFAKPSGHAGDTPTMATYEGTLNHSRARWLSPQETEIMGSNPSELIENHIKIIIIKNSIKRYQAFWADRLLVR
jgi:hypothetical protein